MRPQPTHSQPPRRGIALLLVVLLLVIVGLVLGVLLKQSLLARNHQSLLDDQAQAACLLDSGRELAWARLHADPNYQGESWVIPASQLAGKGIGEITIRVDPAQQDQAARTFTVIAEFPRHEVRQVRKTGQFRFPGTTTTSNSTQAQGQPTGEPRS
jgi:hypothetical protein